MTDYLDLPSGLPAPDDDGAADHIRGSAMPHVVLRATSWRNVALDELPAGRTIVYVYPMTGRPGVALPDGWDDIPGARGCTPESCGFRDHFSEIRDAGASALYGLSSQSSMYQAELTQRLDLPFPILSDPDLKLSETLGLPTFAVDGLRFYKRLTLVLRNGFVEHVFYPVFPPDQHAGEVLRWLLDRG